MLLDVEKRFHHIKAHHDLGEFLTALGRVPEHAELALGEQAT